MSLLSNFQLMSQYNQLMNQRVYQVAQQLNHEIIVKDQGAFFGSILGTLNHIYVADIIWLKRFAQLPPLNSYRLLYQTVANNLESLQKIRQVLDMIIIDWYQEIEPKDLENYLQYLEKFCFLRSKYLFSLIFGV